MNPEQRAQLIDLVLAEVRFLVEANARRAVRSSDVYSLSNALQRLDRHDRDSKQSDSK